MPKAAPAHYNKPVRKGPFFLLSLAATMLAMAAGANVRFPFVLPLGDSSKTVVDVSALNPAPLAEDSRIGVRRGHFFDRSGRRVRFLAVNVTAGSCFPPKERAPAIAARMRKFGINCVRLHHLDAPWARPNVFHFEGGSYGKRTDALDPASLDRLDWFVHQLKEHGIYVDVNLHVTRQFCAADGFPDTDRIDQQGKVVGYFEPGMIARQKLYATQLLARENPYTKTVFGKDPVVAMVEITNEDSLLGSADGIPSLPGHYTGILREGWNRWLRKKHRSTRRLLDAWNSDAQPLGGNMIRNSGFADGVEGWTVERHDPAAMEASTFDPAGETNAPPGRVLKLERISPDGTGWHLQFHQTGLDLEDGRRYTLSFAARAEGEREIGVDCRLDQAPWTHAGLSASAGLTLQWKRFTYVFTAENTVPGHCRISFVVGDRETDVYLAGVSLRPGGGGIELGPGESLEAGTVPLPRLAETPPGRDWAEYLMQVEGDFTKTMRDHVRSLGVKAPVACSQASYGGIGGVWRESNLDWVDMHSYWQHPHFPNRPWDSNDYRIGNTSMVREPGGGTLPGLAMHRVSGMPFTVSEYDHPAPNEYAAECVPMIFACAALQDWDGIFLFAYSGENLDRTHIDGFFDTAGHPAKMAFLPAVARLFLEAQISPAPVAQTLLVPRRIVPELVARRTEYSFWNAAGPRAPRADVIGRRTEVEFRRRGSLRIETGEEKGKRTGRIEWTAEPRETAVFTALSPQTRIAAGFLGGRKLDLDGVKVEMEPTARNFASIALASMDGKPVEESRSLLLVVVGKVENEGIKWNAERNLAADSWNESRTMAETAAASFAVPTAATGAEVFALDGTGARKSRIESTVAGGAVSFRTGPAGETIWYEIAATGTE